MAKEAGVSQSTLTRLGQNKRPDLGSLAALASWANFRVDDVVRRPNAEPHDEGHPTPLTMISTHLRADRNLSDEAATALEEVIRASYERLGREQEVAKGGLRYGFKTEAEELAKQLRGELGLEPAHPLCSGRLPTT